MPYKYSTKRTLASLVFYHFDKDKSGGKIKIAFLLTTCINTDKYLALRRILPTIAFLSNEPF